MNISIFLRTLWRGRYVGQDTQGNKYFEDKKNATSNKPRRWVIYKGHAEASKIPAPWHGWLHYTTSEPPNLQHRYSWEKEHLPNLTGTPYAHKPKGLQGLVTEKDYEAWVPNNNPEAKA